MKQGKKCSKHHNTITKMLRIVFKRRFYGSVARSNFLGELRDIKYDFMRRKNITKSDLAAIPVEDEDAHHRAVLEIINKTKKAEFSDPGNRKLDLSGSNAHIYNNVVASVKERKRKRVAIADQKWNKQFHAVQDQVYPQISDRNIKELLIVDAIRDALTNSNFSVEKSGASIAVGDVVALLDDTTSFYIVVGTPTRLLSPYYTYINKQGEIVFGPKDRIRLRAPQVIPAEFTEVLRCLVSLEDKWEDIAPIGYPDAEFSKAGQIDVSGGSNHDALISEVRDDDDLIINSASGQLLTNSDVLTYQVTQNARSLYSDALRDFGVSVSTIIPLITKKLEYLHSLLQVNPNGEVIDSPTTISIFELMSKLAKLSIDKDGRVVRNSDIFEHNSVGSLGSTSLGKLLGATQPCGLYSTVTFLSLVLSLRFQSRLWNLNQQNPSNAPISVTVLPLSNAIDLKLIILKLKSSDESALKFAQFVIDSYKQIETTSKPEFYLEIVNLFKAYIAGNLSNDAESEVAIVSVIRKVEELARLENLTLRDGPEASFEFSKLRCFEILQILKDPFEEGKNGWENPIVWSVALQLPDRGVLKHSDNQRRYYDYLDAMFLGKEHENMESDDLYTTDPLAAIREVFNAPIYCIDSETAHEIDDGIAIEEKNGNYLISVHVANPSSYIKPESNLSNIAFNKATTTYLPEDAIMMLPKFMAEVAGLGIHGSKTRTFVVQYELPGDLINTYIKSKKDNSKYVDEAILGTIREKMTSSAVVKATLASNFPQGFTYTKVNEILNDKSNIEQYENGSLRDTDSINLFKLHSIAQVLKDIRVFSGNAVSFKGRNSNLKVDYNELQSEKLLTNEGVYRLSVSEQGPVITINSNGNQGHDSKSQLLVSEFMISANNTASNYATTNNIGVVYRYQDMKLNNRIIEEIGQISKENHLLGRELDVENTSKILPFLTSARLLTSPKMHQSLGVNSYATVTSPLRRFADMINHWKLEDHLLKQERISDMSLTYIANHLQSCELVNRQTQRFSHNFWIGVFLKQYQKFITNKEVSPVKFNLLVQSRPNNGVLKVQMLEFGDIQAQLVVSPSLLEDFKPSELQVGTIIRGYFIFEKLDFIENEFVLKMA